MIDKLITFKLTTALLLTSNTNSCSFNSINIQYYLCYTNVTVAVTNTMSNSCYSAMHFIALYYIYGMSVKFDVGLQLSTVKICTI